jgi:DNA-binding HxlR family transcriptional regulator
MNGQRDSTSHRHMHVPNCTLSAGIGTMTVPTGKRRREKQIRQRCFRRRKSGVNTTQGSKIASSIFIGRWTPRILFSLRERPYRHGELRRHLGTVSQRMLTRTLRNLEYTGLIMRRVTESRTVAVEYSWTQTGSAFIAPLRGMCRWATRYRMQLRAGVPMREP